MYLSVEVNFVSHHFKKKAWLSLKSSVIMTFFVSKTLQNLKQNYTLHKVTTPCGMETRERTFIAKFTQIIFSFIS